MKVQATTVLIPDWSSRLSTALMQPAEIVLPFKEIVDPIADGKARLKTLRALVMGAQGTVEQGLAFAKSESTIPIVEAVVQAFELACRDTTVRADIGAQVKRVVFAACPPGQAKSLQIDETGSFVYCAAFHAGKDGIFNKKEILYFLEDRFFAQEREIVNRFATDGLPKLIERLHRAVGAPVNVQIDVPAMLATCAEKAGRLGTARTLVTRTKMTEKASVAAKSTLDFLNHKAATLASKASKTAPPPRPEPAPEKEPVNSPNVLLPLVEAFEFCCGQHESVRAAIASVISTITIVMTPGDALVATLNLHQAVGEPIVAPSPHGVPPIQNGVLVYNGCFEAGHKGCFTKSTIIDILEAHFRCQEKGYVHGLMEHTVPDANGRLSSVMGKAVDIEVQWTTIFRDGLTTAQRLDIAQTLAGTGSQFVIQPMVQGISTVVQKIDEAVPQHEMAAGPPDNPVKQKIARVVICGIAGATAKPLLALVPLAAGADAGMALMYTCAFERGASGAFDVVDFKANLRRLFGIETPKDEKGLSAMLGKADATVTKMGSELSKKMGKMKFW